MSPCLARRSLRCWATSTWITAGHLSQQFEESLSSESASLLETYNRAGRDGLGELIEARVKDRHFDEWGYLLLDSSLNKIAGNMPAWPPEFAGPDGSGNFSLVRLGFRTRPIADARPRHTPDDSPYPRADLR
jgi:hypothetical protein